VLVLRTVVQEHQETRRAQAVDDCVEDGLSLAVDPVEVLEDQEQRLLSRFSKRRRSSCSSAR
jgi:hypothetical protein